MLAMVSGSVTTQAEVQGEGGVPGGGEKMSGGAPTPPRKLLVQSQASFCFVGSVSKLMHFIPTQFPDRKSVV